MRVTVLFCNIARVIGERRIRLIVKDKGAGGWAVILNGAFDV